MAKRTDLTGEVVSIVKSAPKRTGSINGQRTRRAGRRGEALSLALAGFTYDQIGERLGITRTGAMALVERTLGEVVNRNADMLRDQENARLDKAQAAIWTKVLAGDLQAVDVFLRISARRARMNGLDAPSRVSLAVTVREEMEVAFAQLEQVILGEVVGGDGAES